MTRRKNVLDELGPLLPPDPEKSEADALPFDPAPLERRRHDGWTEARQRGFIASLRRVGAVGLAARSVGKSARSAYKLRGRPGAESFAAAWDEALAMGFDNMRSTMVDRALHGTIVPRFYRGRHVGWVHRFDDRAGLALLAGRGRDVVENRADIEIAREYRRGDLAAARAGAAAREAEAEAAEANLRAMRRAEREFEERAAAACDDTPAPRRRRAAARPRALPRIRPL